MCWCWGGSLLRWRALSSSWCGESSGWRAGAGAAVGGPEPPPLRGPGRGASSGHDTISTPAELSSAGRFSGLSMASSKFTGENEASAYLIQKGGGRQEINRRRYGVPLERYRVPLDVVRLNVKMCHYPWVKSMSTSILFYQSPILRIKVQID